ncbi:NUDIX hydrolase [Tenacibaculum finnmarkense]|uniref:NUDIX hydrolase n=1 Tax=Tenacibaculum finnmarkense TaxID=2781243 RepID=UPI00187B3608|nr:NUDIX domain-containing protein [Tenacibaculum finnmarkense]MBE7644539.1 NUDIX domain-containing protein [Tenacibaculum finnmarkense genomovar ulcerans]MCG8732542.1 NUDIX hydrolase [Tenacibaculum finnmarkense]
MILKQEIKLAVDAVVFGYEAGNISILLIKRKYEPFKGKWAIPGGFILADESLETAVERELLEETGVKINYLEQLYTFGNPERDPRKRVVTVAYFGLVKPNCFKLKASTDAEQAQWFSIDKLPELSFDHQDILDKAINRLRAKITYEPIGFELLESKFPFSDLEKLYATLLGRAVDRRNFRKKIMNLNILDELDEKTSKGSGRPAKLFQFNEKRFFQLKKEGIIFDI